MARMGSLRRFNKDAAQILEFAIQELDWNLVSEVQIATKKVEEAMIGGKKWSEVENELAIYLNKIRETCVRIESEEREITSSDNTE